MVFWALIDVFLHVFFLCICMVHGGLHYLEWHSGPPADGDGEKKAGPKGGCHNGTSRYPGLAERTNLMGLKTVVGSNVATTLPIIAHHSPCLQLFPCILLCRKVLAQPEVSNSDLTSKWRDVTIGFTSNQCLNLMNMTQNNESTRSYKT
jgi:hypothetical protein